MQSEINSHFTKHYNDLLESFHFHFKKSLHNPEIEDLHNIRVSVKKLRAMWSLFEAVSDGNWKKTEHYNLFSTLFDATGVVRESQVNLIITERYNVNYLINYAGHLHELQKKADVLFFNEMKLFSLDKLEELNNTLFQELKKQSNTMTMEQLISFVLGKTRKVNRLKNKLPNDRILHKIRIHLKAVSEILTMACDWNINGALEDLLYNVKWLNEQIGDWHDFKVFLESIKNFVSSMHQSNQIVEIENFIARTEQWQDKKQIEIKTLLGRSLSREQQKKLEAFI